MVVNIKPKDLVWEKYNREHIQKHGLTVNNIATVLSHPDTFIGGDAKKGRFSIYGYCGSKAVLIFLSREGKGYYVASARSANKREREHFESLQ